MSVSIVCNFFAEPNTLPGFFECYSKWADDIIMWSCPPSGAPPDEESIEIVKKWGGKLRFANIDDGFGVIRTQMVQSVETDWAIISDADERIWAQLPIYECHGEGRYPDVADPKLSVGILEPSFSQVDSLKDMLKSAAADVYAVRFSRRHWFDWGMHRPCQKWTDFPDWQLRCMRCSPHIGYERHVKMHEKARDYRTGADPNYVSGDTEVGPFYDHYHMAAKAMEPEQRRVDVEIYNRLDSNRDINEIYKK